MHTSGQRPMQMLAATNNQKKLDEIRRIMRGFGIEVLGLAAAGLDIDPEESGESFAENARIKAQAVFEAAGGSLPVLADDSGLCVDALGGAPGVYSARYAGGHGDDAANNQKLLDALRSVPKPLRTARFVSAIACIAPGAHWLETQGACEGEIGFAPSGTGGFGYDPLFYVGGKSFAELSDARKDELSHRGAALRSFAARWPVFARGFASEI